MSRILRRSTFYFYKEPFCVPAWGWREAGITLRMLLGCLPSQRVCEERIVGQLKASLGLTYVIPVNSGSAALELGLRALNLQRDAEVVVPSYICTSVVEAIRAAGCVPRYADVDDNLQISLATVSAAVTTNTKCILVAHLFGGAAPIDSLELFARARGIVLIDDAAQSLGTMVQGRAVGTFGDFGIVSCGAGKILSGSGGGAFVTNNRRLYEAARRIELSFEEYRTVLARVLGTWIWRRFRRATLPARVILDAWLQQPPKKHHPARISRVEALIATCQIRNRARRAERLRSKAVALAERLSHVVDVRPWSEDAAPLKLIAEVPVDSLEAIRGALSAIGVETTRGYHPCHLGTPIDAAVLPNTDRLWARILWIPVNA